jgi:hypothetical protein
MEHTSEVTISKTRMGPDWTEIQGTYKGVPSRVAVESADYVTQAGLGDTALAAWIERQMITRGFDIDF